MSRLGLENVVQGHGDIVLRGEIDNAVKDNINYLMAIKKAVRQAARHFIDYWSGPRTWERMPPVRREPIAAAMGDVRHWEHALFRDRRTVADFAALDMPVLYMSGSETTAAARGVARQLVPALPHVRHRVFHGLGHMGPLTDPAPVHDVLTAFLVELEAA